MGYIWLGLFILFLFIEGITDGLVSIWFAVGALVVFFLSGVVDSVTIQLAVFIVVSLLTLFLFRKTVVRKTQKKIEKTNTDRLIGRQGYVIEAIDNLHATGRVKANGTSWMARSLNDELIPKDSAVEIMKIDGVKLIVQAAAEKNKEGD